MNNRIISAPNYPSIIVKGYNENSNTFVAKFDKNDENYFFISHSQDIMETGNDESCHINTWVLFSKRSD